MSSLVTSIGPDIEHINVEEKDIKMLKLGYYVEVTICGYVSSLSAPTGDYDGSPNIGLKVSSREVRKVGSAQAEGFRKLADDSDEEDPVIAEEYTK